MLFFLGVMTLCAQLIKNERVKESVVLIGMLCSIPVVTFQFMDYAGITIWVFPLVLMTTSLVFGTRVPLVLLTAVSIATQLLIWVNSSAEVVHLDRFDYIARIGIFLIAFFICSFVNTAYIKRVKENTYQIEFQTLVSEVSSDFVSVTQLNIDENIHNMRIRNCFLS